MIIFFGYTARKNGCMESLNCFFFPDRCFLSQWNGFVVCRNKYICKKQEKNDVWKNESRKHSTELSVYKIKQAGDEYGQKNTHRSITTLPPLDSDAMSSDDSKDEQNNATTKLGRQGYLSKEDYQSCHESSQGKWDHLWRDERQDKGCTEKRMQEINSTNWKRTIKTEGRT